jgi:hypothetical protein
MSKRLAKVLRMLSMAIAAPLLPPPNHQLPRDEAGWRWSSLRSAAARVGFGGFRMSKKLSSPSESLFAEAAAERAEDGSAEDCRIFPVWPFCVNVNTSDAISGTGAQHCYSRCFVFTEATCKRQPDCDWTLSVIAATTLSRTSWIYFSIQIFICMI